MKANLFGTRVLISRFLPHRVSGWMRRALEHVSAPPDFSEEELRLCQEVLAFTMTSPERMVALLHAVRYVVANDIPGSIVECGVWRGGSMMVAAKALLALGVQRALYLFDTFEGMTPPSDADRSWRGVSAEQLLSREAREEGFNIWCIADEADVRANVSSTGYPMEQVHLVKGKVEETLPAQAPDTIALLRLDTDWYESTRHELEHLYSRLSPGGVLIIDDYGYWQGSRRAVDEFFAKQPRKPLLQRIDMSGRLAIKA
ncbi:TylF/MycF/NovP-related O-methyltransferase [Corallococcus sp. AB018]|uniref:TylF/MycF/NovP-related O-methyltransferase n=1 Tax=Corallococcus sp. AB018 TaxID=2316715 RepID=UPI0018F7048D|nr:TylF/MycF/NovP-related O-methyltransferase [Corallococcus sp. AB018]